MPTPDLQFDDVGAGSDAGGFALASHQTWADTGAGEDACFPALSAQLTLADVGAGEEAAAFAMEAVTSLTDEGGGVEWNDLPKAGISGQQNPFFDIAENGTFTDAQIVSLTLAALADLGVSWVRFGPGSKWGGGLAWQQVDEPPAKGYDCVRVTEYLAGLILGAGLDVVVNVNPKRVSDLAKYTDGFGTSLPRLPYDQQEFAIWVAQAVGHLQRHLPAPGVSKFLTHNEPITALYWNQNVPDPIGDYGRLVWLTCRAIREALPSHLIGLSYMTLDWATSVAGMAGALARGSVPDRAERLWDLVDVHDYGLDQTADAGPYAHLYPYDTFYARLQEIVQSLVAGGSAAPVLWVTETGTYSGSPQSADSGYYPTQTQIMQAREGVRRMLWPYVVGVQRVAWTTLFDGPIVPGDNQFYAFSGLLTRTGDKKIAYYAMQKVGAFLDGCAVTSLSAAQQIGPGQKPYVRGVRRSDATGETHIVWWDVFREGDPAPPNMTAHFRVRQDATAADVFYVLPRDPATGDFRVYGVNVNPATDFPVQRIAITTPGALTLTFTSPIPLWVASVVEGQEALPPLPKNPRNPL